MLGVVLALVAAVIIPSPVAADASGSWAKPGTKGGVTPFSAGAELYVSKAGTPGTPEFLGKKLVIQPSLGEEVSGAIVSSEWAEFAGCQFLITQDCQTRLNFASSKLTSEAAGSIVIVKDGVPVMTGSLDGLIRGDFTFDGSGNVTSFDNVVEVVNWTLQGIPGGAFDGVAAKGCATACLNWTPVGVNPETGEIICTLVGGMEMRGIYRD
jgi:hypothetical protein